MTQLWVPTTLGGSHYLRGSSSGSRYHNTSNNAGQHPPGVARGRAGLARYESMIESTLESTNLDNRPGMAAAERHRAVAARTKAIATTS